jgi:hypothetical protein
MYVNGIGISEIARTFTNEKILRPTAHMGYKTGVRCDDFDEYFWHTSMITKIIRRQEYCGDTVNFRTTRMSYKSHKIIFNPKEKLRIFYDTQEPIITREIFDKAQRIIGEPKKKPRSNERALYYGILFCEKCGHTMRIKHRKGDPKNNSYFCSLASKKWVLVPFTT